MERGGRFNLLWFAPLALLCFLNAVPECNAVSVMSVDFGSEWMKVAIVSPGVPMEIALNKESKRKTPIAIAFRDGERTFGEDALTIGVRFPKQCYVYLLELLGKRVDHPLVKLFQQRFPYYEIVPHPQRSTVVFKHDEETEFAVEELIAMMLKKAQEMAILSAGQAISDAVITVPGYFNQAERKAMLHAASLADIKVLQLINDYTAVALNHGIFRRKDFNETAQYIMLYDMGASSTTATVISYQVIKTKEKGFVETHPQLSILGVGYDRTLGGLEMQLRLRDHLAQKFNEMKKTKSDVFKNPRSLAKLFKEAGRLKTVLSANADHFAQVEGLIDEIDFKLQVSREELEKLCQDLFERVKQPVTDALKTSGLTMDVISQVILVGAGTRVPGVQEKLQAAVGQDLAKSLNTDEAAVMGAVYKAADLSAGFKVKKFLTRDGVVFPIQVTFERETDAGPKLVKRTLFGSMNPYPQKKILTFNKYLSDFEFNVVYGDLDFLRPSEIENIGSTNLSRVHLSGVGDAIRKHQDSNSEIKGVKAHFQMDESGLLTLSGVELVVEKIVAEGELNAADESPLSKLGTTISNLFKSEEPAKEAPPAEAKVEKGEEKEEEKKEEEGKETNKTEPEGKPAEGKEEAPPKPAKPILLKEVIKSKEEPFTLTYSDEGLNSQSKSKLDKLNAADEERRKRESSLNALESFVFETQSRLDSEDYAAGLSEKEKEKISAAVTKTRSWLDEEAWESDADTLLKHLQSLEKETQAWFFRVAEHKERPEAIAALKNMLNGSNNFFLTITNLTAQQVEGNQQTTFTSVELELLNKTIAETQEWMDKAVEEQSKLPLFENPKLTVKKITDKMGTLNREVQYLVTKAKIWKPKPEEKPVKEEPVTDKKTGSESNKTESGEVPQASSQAPQGETVDQATPQPSEGSQEETDPAENEVPDEEKHKEL